MIGTYQQPYEIGAYVKEGMLCEDEWRLAYPLDESRNWSAENDKVILPLKDWLSSYHNSMVGPDRLGLLLTVDDDISDLELPLDDIPVVAIWFNEFSDGRGFSLATTIRERFQYQGELRAVGYYMLDQLHYFKRCGINAFCLRREQNADMAINVWNDFAEVFKVQRVRQ